VDKARKRLMNESFDIHGIWYLPEQNMEQDGVEGILKYSPDKIVLDLIGTFTGEDDEVFFSMQQTPEKKIIYGFSNYGEKITLFDCYPSNAKMSAPGFDTISYSVNWFFAGTQQITSNSEKIIESCTFSLTYLDAWLDLRVIEITTNRENGSATISIDLEKILTQKKCIEIKNPDISISEELNRHIEFPKDYYSEEATRIVIHRFYRLSSKTGNLLSYDDCFENLHILRRLLVMLTGGPLHFLYIDLHLPNETIRSFDESEHEYKHCCRAFFTQVGNISDIQKISPHKPGSMLIYRKDIFDSIENIFSNWFLQQAKLSEIVNPYISGLYLPAYQETKFLNTVRCLETYHRYFFDVAIKETQIVDMEYEEDKIILLSFAAENISDDNKQEFIDRINYEDEGSLQKCLKALIKQTPASLIEKLFGQLNSKQKSKVVLTIVQTRNYYTHRDNQDKYPFAVDDRNTLDSYIKKLNVILQFWILKCVGVDSTIIEKRLSEYRKNYSAFSSKIDC